MLKSKIKTHKLGTVYSQPHFFILNKGYHSGKPAVAHWSNCYVFLADDEEEKEFYYFVMMGLWELELFVPHLIGSVVLYIRIGDLIDIVEECVNAINTGNRQSADVTDALVQIEALKANLQNQVSYLMQLRRMLFSRHLNR